LSHPSDLSRTWQNTSKQEPAYVHEKNAQVSNGKPDLMYFVPEVFAVHDCGKKSIKKMLMYVAKCTAYAGQYVVKLLKPDLHSPTTAHDALELYRDTENC